MSPSPSQPTPRRADAEENRRRILAAARTAFATPGANTSMTEIARLAGVGVGTLYRNFPTRPELLEAVFVDDVDAVCAAALDRDGADAAAALEAWLRRFVRFYASKRHVGSELLTQGPAAEPFLDRGRDRVIAAGRPLLEAAQQAGDVRADLNLEQVLDLLIAVARIDGAPDYLEPILASALSGLRTR